MKKTKKGFKFLLFFLLFVIIFLYLFITSTDMILEYGRVKYECDLTTIAYESISLSLDEETNYNEYVYVDKNSNGDINMVIANSYKVNSIASKIALNYSELFNGLIKEGVDIPWGVFTGIRLLSGTGKTVNVNLLSINSVNVDIFSVFESAGINQTKQQLYAIIKPSVSIVTKYKTTSYCDEIKVILYDNIILGRVPETYLESRIIGKG